MMKVRKWAALAMTGFVAGSVGLVMTAGVALAGEAIRVRVTVVDGEGAPLRPATVTACPYRRGVPDCTRQVIATTNRQGVAKLTLDGARRYEFGAFVADPTPPWACPGTLVDGRQLYLAGDPFSADARDVPRDVTLTIVEPSVFDCVPVTVTDAVGNALPTAGLFVCPLAPDGTPCPGPSFEGSDPDGVIRFAVDPSVTYRLSAFIVNSGWPCPGFVGPNGDTLHFSAERDILGADLASVITTFVIDQPSVFDCVPVTVTDAAGNALPTAGLFVCPLAPDGTPCPGPSFEGSDPDGVIRFAVDPSVTYRLSAFIVNSGWPCPGFVGPNGDTFHFSAERDILGADVGGSVFVIRQQSAQECP